MYMIGGGGEMVLDGDNPHLVLEHFLVDAEVRVRVEVVVLGGLLGPGRLHQSRNRDVRYLFISPQYITFTHRFESIWT